MVVIDSLKLNKFRSVAIPRNCDYFARYGEFNPLQSQYSGDEDIPQQQSKMDAIIAEDAAYRDFVPPVEKPE